MVDRLYDIDLIFKTLYSGTKKQIAESLNYTVDNVSKLRKLKSLPDLGFPSADLNLLLIYICAENNKRIDSNEKKILSLLIFGSEESVDPEKHFTCDPNKDKTLYSCHCS